MTQISEKYQISINAGPQAVFNYVSDFTKHGEWTDGLRVEAVSDVPTAVGSEFSSVGKMMGKDIKNQLKITAYDAPSKIAFTASAGKNNFHQELSFEAQGEGTLLRRTVTFEMNPIMAMMFKVVISPLLAGPNMNKTLRNLKAKLEA